MTPTRTSGTGPNAETTSETGESWRCSPLSDQTVDMEQESLPTGMESEAAGQNSIATARTVS